ncbi:hypothetical protein ACHAQA_006066 [Verticillium albo-atrum]
MPPAPTALRYVAATKKSPFGILYLHCRVKPGAAKAREGVTALTDEVVELCVAAQPREGEANKAVVQLLSEILHVPKSDLQITQGMKGRDKTVALSGVKEGEEFAAKVMEMLKEAAR